MYIMRLARAKEEEIFQLRDFLSEIEEFGNNESYGDFYEVDWENYEVLSKINHKSPEDFIIGISDYLSKIHYRKILFNCSTLLENCADLELDYLDFNKDIKKGLELLGENS
jgi:hypothetical protein